MAETTDLLGIKNLCRFWRIIKTHLGLKVDKVSGKGLSTNDFTTAEKDKLAAMNVYYGTCDTSPARNPKIVVCPEFELTSGAVIVVKFTSENFGAGKTNQTLNVNGTGAKYIRYQGEFVSITRVNFHRNKTYAFAYDGTYYNLVGDLDTTYSAATTSKNGLMSAEDKTKLDGVASGAEVNVQADWSETDTNSDAYIQNKPTVPTRTSELTNDSNFVSDANYVHTDNNFTTTLKNKLDGIASGAEVNQNAFSNVVIGSTTVSADAKTDTLTLVAGSNVTLTPDATNDKVTIAATDTKYAPASANPLMDGTVAVGKSTKYAREDHRHPTDTSRAAASHKHAWNTLVTTHKNTQANFTNPRNTYSELLIVAYFPDLNDTTKNKYFTTVVPTSALSSSVLEVWVGGGRGDSTNGYANSGARAVCNLTQTYIKGVAASESSNNRLSATTWIVYAR